MSSAEATKTVRAAEQEVQEEAELGLIRLEKGKGRSHGSLQLPNRRGHRRGIQTLLGFAQRWDKQWPGVAVKEISGSYEENLHNGGGGVLEQGSREVTKHPSLETFNI